MLRFLHKEDEKNEVISNNDAQIKENDEVVARLLTLVENLSERRCCRCTRRTGRSTNF